jgi:ATP-dependent helicase HrpA
MTGWARNLFTEARAVRRLVDDPRARSSLASLAGETHAHLQRLFAADRLLTLSPDARRQLPRQVKAEERRWQRLFARGGEPPGTLRELQDWSGRLSALQAQLAAELRWLPAIDELSFWIEEYRVSLYAQELKTLGPVSATRLRARAAEIEAWLTR